MASQFTVDDIVPLIAALIARQQSDDASLYCAIPPTKDEFSVDEEPLGWEGEEWENVA